jgi:heme/copper-type cytochrome/quinol oxidase subunit 1
MPRRIATYPANPGWADLNLLSTTGSFVLLVGSLAFVAAVIGSLRRPADAPADPWAANSLEWATSSPPPHHNFGSLPPIRSERPVFDARLAARGVAAQPTDPLTGRAGDAARQGQP